jgi:ABC-type phosphate transport system auxiliary subunit
MNMLAPIIITYSLIIAYLLWRHFKLKDKIADLQEEQERIVKGWARASLNFRDYRERLREDELDLRERLDGCLESFVEIKWEKDRLEKEYDDLTASYKKLQTVCHDQGLHLQKLNEHYTVLFNKSQPHDQ